jgi:hypothetical protein
MTSQSQLVDEEHLRVIIEDAIASFATKMDTMPYCKMRAEKSAKIEEAVLALKKIVIGNGEPQDSLLWRQKQSEIDINKLRFDLMDRSKAKDGFDKTITYFTDKILPSLVTSFILGLIAFLFALQQHLIVKLP